MALKDNDYNKARKTLIDAGSKSAEKSHEKHTQKNDSPIEHGVSLLQEARDEFRKIDSGKSNLISGMTSEHYDAVHKAARQMNIENW